MSEEKRFFIDVINLVPEGSILLIQAPSLENSIILDLMKETVYEFYKMIELSTNNKNVLLKALNEDDFEEDIQSMEIRYLDKRLFESFDGCEIGIFSKFIHLPKWFSDKYIELGNLVIANDW